MRTTTSANGGYSNLLPWQGSDLLLTAAGDTTASALAFDHYYVRADSLGRWRGNKHYVPGYQGWGGGDLLLPQPGHGALWVYNVRLNYYNGTAGAPPAITAGQLVRLDSTGRITAQRTFGGGYAWAQAVAPLLDGSYVVVGYKSRPYTPGPGYLVNSGWAQRLKANGDTINLPEFIGRIDERYDLTNVQATAQGGYLVSGRVYPTAYVPVFDCCPQPQGYVAEFDSLGVLQWERRLPGTYPQRAYGSVFHAQPLANGQVLVIGMRNSIQQANATATVAVYPASGTGPAQGEFSLANTSFEQRLPLAVDGTMIFAGGQAIYRTATIDVAGQLTKFAGLGVPYVPNYCQHPPVPNAGYSLNPSRDTLTLVDFSAGGPRFAQVERWRWHFPDGSFYEGRTPPPHRFAQVPAAGAAVTLTITNNLGCTSTQTLYPFGLPTAAQQAHTWATGASVFPNPATNEKSYLDHVGAAATGGRHGANSRCAGASHWTWLRCFDRSGRDQYVAVTRCRLRGGPLRSACTGRWHEFQQKARDSVAGALLALSQSSAIYLSHYR